MKKEIVVSRTEGSVYGNNASAKAIYYEDDKQIERLDFSEREMANINSEVDALAEKYEVEEENITR